MAEAPRKVPLLAAVAHELNNPTTAVSRGAARLAEVLERYGVLERQVGGAGLADSPRLASLVDRVHDTVRSPRRIDAIDRGDAEGDVEGWLEQQGIADPWDLAPVLVELSLGPEELSGLMDEIGDHAFSIVLPWLVTLQEVHALLAEIEQGVAQVSQLVKDLRAHTYRDRTPVRSVDIHEGLENTLRVLRTKIEPGIEVRRVFADALPGVRGHGSELNQVWTNLIDNAVHAMDGEGTLTLRTRASDGWVEVDIEDEGPGIPRGIRDRIFDAFFTTKLPGEGTGLGLDITYDIVVNRHGGDLSVESEPGRTTFTVRLPENFEATARR